MAKARRRTAKLSLGSARAIKVRLGESVESVTSREKPQIPGFPYAALRDGHVCGSH